MGEGWSDFFALINTVKPGDVGEMRRGMGTFVFRQPNDGTGIRRVPYSTDMSIDPHTLATVALSDTTSPHQIGEVWATVIWDMYGFACFKGRFSVSKESLFLYKDNLCRV
jgi:extracellular elastinolytic metalloproteinase